MNPVISLRFFFFSLVVFLLTGAQKATAQTTFEIWNWEDLSQVMAKQTAGYTNFMLMQDLGSTAANSGNGTGCTYADLNKRKGYYGYDTYVTNVPGGWLPLAQDNLFFKGVFDGNNHVIRNLYINRPTEFQVALFGHTNGGALIKNLGLEGTNITGKQFVGSFVGYNQYGTIKNCYNTGRVSEGGGNSGTTGGIVGQHGQGGIQLSYIENCYNTGDIIGSGGIAGYNAGRIQYCYNSGNITNGGSSAGGIVGINGYDSILYCYNTGNISGTVNIGGIVGYEFMKTRHCYSAGNVTGTGSVGGVIGKNSSSLKAEAVYYDKELFSGNCIGSGTDSGTQTGGLKTSEMVAYNSYDPSGKMSGLGSTYWIKPPYPITKEGCHEGYYPELKAFAQPPASDSSKAASKRSVWTAYYCGHILYGNRYSEGYGTDASPYQIYSASQLDHLRSHTANKESFSLMNDIDLYSAPYNTNTGWDPIGDESDPFSGKLIGNNKTIKGLWINKPGVSNVGLFGCLGEANLQSFLLKGHNLGITGLASVAGLSGSTNGQIGIEQVGVDVDVTATVGNSAGFISDIKGTSSINQSYAAGKVSSLGNGMAGGFLSVIENKGGVSTIANSYSLGTVSTQGEGAGFISTVKNQSTFTNCYATGIVNTNNYSGGFISDVIGNPSGSYCYYDTYTTSKSADDLAFSKTTSEMIETLPQGFDPTLWSIDPNTTYPYLKWQKGRIGISDTYTASKIEYSQDNGSSWHYMLRGSKIENPSNLQVKITNTNASKTYNVYGTNSLLNPSEVKTLNLSTTQPQQHISVGVMSESNIVAFVPNRFVITYHPNGASGSMPTQEAGVGEPVALLDNGFTYSGSFLGWSTLMDGSGVFYYPGDSLLSLFEDMTLYAQWTTAWQIWNWEDLAKVPQKQTEGCTEYVLMQDIGDPSVPGSFGDGTNCPYINPAKKLGSYGYDIYVNNATGGWAPIGNSVSKFKGNFNGNSNSVNEIKIDRTTDYQGIFGYIDSLGVIQNLSLSGSIKGANRVGGIAGMNEGRIEFCVNTATITGSGDWIGGIVGEHNRGKGYSDALMSDCANYGKVLGNNYTGGIAGYIGYQAGYGRSILQNCTNGDSLSPNNVFNGNVTGTKNVGGITGFLSGVQTQLLGSLGNFGTITGSVSTSSGDYIGGIVGYGNFINSTPDELVNKGDVSGRAYIGGLVGMLSDGKLSGTSLSFVNKGRVNATQISSYAGGGVGWATEKSSVRGVLNQGAVNGISYVGGVVGNNYGTVDSCINEGSVLGTNSYTGGVVGLNRNSVDSTATVSHSTNLGHITGYLYVGGIAGSNEYSGSGKGYAILSNCWNGLEALSNDDSIGRVNSSVVSNGNALVGGILGRNNGNNAQVRDSIVNYGKISASGGTRVGGIAGNLSIGEGYNYVLINKGLVTGSGNIGGIAGDFSKGILDGTMAFNYASVEGATDNTGGAVGISGDWTTIQNFKNDATIIGKNRLGGVVGTSMGIVIACQNSGTIIGSNEYIGGVVGASSSNNATEAIVANCTNTGRVSGLKNVGGIVGSLLGMGSKLSLILNCTNGLSSSVGDANLGRVVATSNTVSNVGGIIGSTQGANATLRDTLRNYGLVSSEGSSVGGIVGYYISSDSTSIGSLQNAGEVIGGNQTGGIFGYCSKATLEGSKINNTGRVIGATAVGGMIGSTANSNISNYINSVNISGTSQVGGIVGLNNNTPITACENQSNVSLKTGGQYLGGIVGAVDGISTISNCHNKASINGSGNYVGGIAGGILNTTANITSCSNSGTISIIGNHVGGIIGRTFASSTITNTCVNYGTLEVTGNYVGGILGSDTTTGYVMNSVNTGSLNINGDTIGGIIGRMNNTTVRQVLNSGSIQGGNAVGGIAGGCKLVSSSSISNSYNTGAIVGITDVGGIGGSMFESSISSCYNTGNILATTNAGGIAGNKSVQVNSLLLKNSFNTGDVSGTNANAITPIAGAGTLSDNYRYKYIKINGIPNISTHTPNAEIGGIKRASDFWNLTTYYSWDFISYWIWDTAYTYPKLQSIPDSLQHYPFSFYYDAMPDERSYRTEGLQVKVIPHKQVANSFWTTDGSNTPPNSSLFTALPADSLVSMPCGINYLHLRGTFDGNLPVTGLFGTYNHAFTSLSINTSMASICLGSSIGLYANGGVSYTWSPAEGLSKTTGAGVMASPNTSTTYQVVGTNTYGCKDSLTIALTVYPYPVVPNITGDSTLCEGGTSQLSSTTGGGNWLSGDPAIATVDNSGQVSGISHGTTNIFYTISENGCSSNNRILVKVRTSVPPSIRVGVKK